MADREPLPEHPTVEDLQDHAEAGIVRRGIASYLFTRNPERSIRMYKWLGMPVLRFLIMKTYGRFYPRGPLSNYRTDPSKPMIERSMRFAVGGSVANEAIHTFAALQILPSMVTDVIRDGDPGISSPFFFVLNVALVGLQRYNRARMIQRVNEELAAGVTFRYDYTNWLGVDSRAEDNFEEAREQQALEGDPLPIPSQRLGTPPVHYPSAW